MQYPRAIPSLPCLRISLSVRSTTDSPSFVSLSCIRERAFGDLRFGNVFSCATDIFTDEYICARVLGVSGLGDCPCERAFIGYD
jgi:hypothetical protein